MKRAALYVRVSTAEQKKHGLSVDNQILALQEYCKEKGYIIAGIYNDAGISARKRYTRRPALLEMVKDCQAGKIDILLFTKLDRFFRSVGDYYEVINQINIPWRAIWEDYETETSAGMFKVNIMLSVAQAEADRTSERIKSTMAYKAERGDYVGSAPTGYKVCGRELVVNEELKPAIETFFETYLTTFSTMAAMRAASEKGLLLRRNVARNILHSPTYAGTAPNGYKCYSFITEEQHQLIQDKIATRVRTPKNPKRFYYFAGLIKCGCCGSPMVARGYLGKLKDGKKIYNEYRCNFSKNETTKNACTKSSAISELKIENYLLKELDNIFAQYELDAEMASKNVNQDISKKKKSLEAKLERLTILFEEGDISIEDYRSKRDAIKYELSLLSVKPIQAPKPLPHNWKEIYAGLDAKHKKIFWNSCIKQITVYPESKNTPKVELR